MWANICWHIFPLVGLLLATPTLLAFPTDKELLTNVA